MWITSHSPPSGVSNWISSLMTPARPPLRTDTTAVIFDTAHSWLVVTRTWSGNSRLPLPPELGKGEQSDLFSRSITSSVRMSFSGYLPFARTTPAPGSDKVTFKTTPTIPNYTSKIGQQHCVRTLQGLCSYVMFMFAQYLVHVRTIFGSCSHNSLYSHNIWFVLHILWFVFVEWTGCDFRLPQRFPTCESRPQQGSPDNLPGVACDFLKINFSNKERVFCTICAISNLQYTYIHISTVNRPRQSVVSYYHFKLYMPAVPNLSGAVTPC